MSFGAIDPVELPLQPAPDTPLWVENYIFEVTSREASFWMHLARQPFNLDLWRDITIVDTYGEDVYLIRGFGKGAHATGPGGAQLRFECLESFKRWRVVFDGAAVRVPRSHLQFDAGGSLRDGPIVPLSFVLELVADAPIWDLTSDIAEQSWGNDHYQQSMRLDSGEIAVDGRTLVLGAGVATRDHTRGPRDFSGLGSYAWIHGGIPGGRHFIALSMTTKNQEGGAVHMARICDQAGLTPADVKQTAIPDTADGGTGDFRLELKGPKGSEIIEGQRLSTVVISVCAPNHLILGPSRDPSVVGHVFASPARFLWNGQECLGYAERTFVF